MLTVLTGSGTAPLFYQPKRIIPRMTRIKICGIRDADTARAAMEAGAYALGLMFYPDSRRYISPAEARVWVADLPPFANWVGVFVNPAAEEVHDALGSVPLGLLQFHGNESPQFCAQFDRPYIKALRIGEQSAEDLRDLDRHYADAEALLLDTETPGQYGGSGRRFDWRRADFGGERPVILAGGLAAGNVAEAIRIARPFAVDVSSGVETDGEKDLDKIRQFCAAVRDAD